MEATKNRNAPIVVFATDAHGVFTMSAGPGLAGLGRRPGEAVGKKASDLYADYPEVLAAAAAALAGETVTYRAVINGHVFESIYVPQRDGQGKVIGVIGAAYDLTPVTQPPPEPGRRYVIHGDRERFGEVRWAWENGVRRRDLEGRRCHEAIFGRSEPCANCPAAGARSSGSVSRVIASIEGEYDVVTAEWTPEGDVRVQIRAVSEALLSELMQARVHVLANHARLTPREREVLDLLLLGRSLAEIGQALSIKARTAKFHAANLLEKMHAESRLDLQRIVLQRGEGPEPRR